MVYECRLDIVDPPPEPEEPPDPEPPHPNDPPDTIEPFEGEGWMECISPVHYHFLEPGDHRFEVRAMDQASPDPNKDLTPATHEWEINPLAEDPEANRPTRSTRRRGSPRRRPRPPTRAARPSASRAATTSRSAGT